jgi:multiple sugar transport system substrate-binding protein
MRVRWGSAVIATVLLGFVAACGGDGSSDDASKSATGSKSLAGTKLTWWATNQGGSIDRDNAVLKESVARFKKESGVDVEFKVVPWPDLFTQITTAVTSGQGPDVLNIGNTWSASLQATGAFVPFEGEALEAIGGGDKFLASTLTATGVKGETPTSVPLYALSYVLFYNKKMFEDAGITAPPKTWSEYVETAKKLTKDGKWGIALEGGQTSVNSHEAFIFGRQNGAELFDGEGKPTFTAPGIVKGVTNLVNLMASDKVVNPSNAQYGDGTQAVTDFAKGKAGMLMWQINAETTIKDAGMDPEEYGVAEVPVADGSSTPIMTMVAGTNVSIFKNTKNMDASLALVKFLTSESEQIKLNSDYQSLPTIKGAGDDAAFSNEAKTVANKILANNAETMPMIPEEGQMETLVGTAVKNLFAKAATKGAVSEADVKAELDAANQKMAAVAGG